MEGKCKFASYDYKTGTRSYYTCDDIPKLKEEFREINNTDRILMSGQRDKAYERYCESMDQVCKCHTIEKCDKCPEEECEGPDKLFCRCEMRNIKVAKKLRQKGQNLWQNTKNQDIYLKILADKVDYLYELPRFVSKSSYDETERLACIRAEFGKIQTQNCNFRFLAEPFKEEVQ